MFTKFKSYLNKLLYSPEKRARKLGVKLGKNCRIIGNVNFGSEPYLVHIGNHVSITDSTFCTHDGGVWVFRNEFPKIDVLAPIKVRDNVFIGTGVTILPGVEIGENVVVGAGSVVVGSLESNAVYAGVPARKIKSIDDYKIKATSRSLDTKGVKNKKQLVLKALGLECE